MTETYKQLGFTGDEIDEILEHGDSISDVNITDGKLQLNGKDVAMHADISTALKYQGTYDASAGTPTLPTPDEDNNGYEWIVNVAGTQTISSVSYDLNVGARIISNGTTFDVFLNEGSVMVGATDSIDGTMGEVPQPLSGEEGRLLRGDGTFDGNIWDDPDTGNVGVGSHIPIETLHVAAGGNVGGAGGSIGLSANSGQGAMAAFRGSLLGNGLSGDYGNLFVQTRSSGSTDLATVMALLSSGNIGIGVTDPDCKLEVAGFTKLGDEAPKLKAHLFTGTFIGTSVTYIAHYMDASKILLAFPLVQANDMYMPYNYYPDENNSTMAYQFQINASSFMLGTTSYTASHGGTVKIFCLYTE